MIGYFKLSLSLPVGKPLLLILLSSVSIWLISTGSEPKSFLESKGISENQIERVEDDDLISVGIAQCSAGDNFRKAVGRYMALRRAIPDMICFFKNNMKIDLNNQDINKLIHDIGCDCYLKKE